MLNRDRSYIQIKFIVPDSLTELLTVKEDNCIKRIQDAGVVSVKLSDKVDTLSERIITVTGIIV